MECSLNAAAPRLPSDDAGGSDEAKPVAQTTGNNAFSLLRLDAMQQSWNKVTAREAKLEADSPPHASRTHQALQCARSHRKAEAYLKSSVLACHDE